MTISAWLFLAAIVLEVVLVVIDLVVWKAYSKEVSELKREVLTYKTAFLKAKNYIDLIYECVVKGETSVNRN